MLESLDRLDNSLAAITLQRYFRGYLARRAIKERFGFQFKTLTSNQQTYTVTDQQVLEARRFVMQIRNGLEPFNYEPIPQPDDVDRISKPLVVLENGAEYEGEWDS